MPDIPYIVGLLSFYCARLFSFSWSRRERTLDVPALEYGSTPRILKPARTRKGVGQAGVGLAGVLIALGIISCTTAPLPVNDIAPKARLGSSGGFTTWSDFLVCDSAWLARETSDDLLRLYNAYLNLVIAVNENHAPQWPFQALEKRRADRIDPSRSQPYCEALRLEQSRAPFVVITLKSLDATKFSDAKVVIGLGKQRATDIVVRLMALTEKVMQEEVSETKPDSPQWWLAWKKIAAWAGTNLPGSSVTVQPRGKSRNGG